MSSEAFTSSETCRPNIPVSSLQPTTNRGFVKQWGRIHLLGRHMELSVGGWLYWLCVMQKHTPLLRLITSNPNVVATSLLKPRKLKLATCILPPDSRFNHFIIYTTINFINSSVFWAITQRRLVKHRRFGTTYRSHLQETLDPCRWHR